MQHFDVIVVGGGLVGLTLARSLHNTDISIAVINHSTICKTLCDEPELRVSAINQANRQRFEKLGVWQVIPENRQCAFQKMQVWDQDSFGNIEFDAQALQVAQLGTIVENQALINALAEHVITQSNVQLFEHAVIDNISLGNAQHALVLASGDILSGSLIVGADGANSQVRQAANLAMTTGEYGQEAIVATVSTAQPHNGVARQAFTPFGPLALLPLADTHLCSIVWSQQSDQARQLSALDTHEFNKALTVASDHCLGVLVTVSDRLSFPLTRRYARQWVKDGVVLCGDAAHTIHPLAGQGANLGFDDAWMLADTLKHLNNNALDKPQFYALHGYRRYERTRKTAALAMLASMEGFHQAFVSKHAVKKHFRGIGLALANKVEPLKQALAKQALGL